MKPLQLSEIARMVGGRLHGDDVVVDAIATDTRKLPGGGNALFVALKGENFDGHEHVEAAVQGGVAAVLVSRLLEVSVPQVLVADTERALGDFAAAVQRQRSGHVVAITGSNGKTSVKSMLLAILERVAPAYANPGNFNNEIGLPLSVLAAPEDARFSVYEMGAGKPGDIAYLAAIARPDVVLVNNIAPAHLERMGSLLGVADTKAAIYDALPPQGVAVINADDAFAPYFAERAHGRRLVRFGLDASADVTARDVVAGVDGSRFTLVTPDGTVPVTLALRGRHNVRNALAAASLAVGLGVSLEAIAQGLQAAVPVDGRMVARSLGNGATLIDDSYNANPGSLAAAIDTLAAMPGAGWLVMGDMRELGADAEAMHAQAGRQARAAGLQRLFALGSLSAAAAAEFGDGASVHADHAALADALATALEQAALVQDALMQDQGTPVNVLVKGSRGSAMDKVVTALLSMQRPTGPEDDTDAA
ncbi:UDP-N-acetylmuramoyl-tripeptide--D-alanyl-D-alanine ligase [Novilysobacter avium]|uniref:UDP-N-acetylmuramoyl-tripeptide--D-alanyl-D-alanine ligase n=1 Tax=Novilysobacter avium TaxID=2781023 RepID=A0A7S6UJQ4_9GAMM|nr:UDP-N-acetylmuramoyl-tripeptide--D-alanyl-D-alanine ligase [Lysobacter avium]QOW21562.1 UDP-N-acetylmuramoyl-tripeptide--D-alanyl-D-alanine ligase [Lysobacter avium]